MITAYLISLGFKPGVFWGVTTTECPHCHVGQMTIYSVDGGKRVMVCTLPDTIAPKRRAGCGNINRVVSITC